MKLQSVATGIAALVALRVARGEGFGAGLDRPVMRWDADRSWLRLLDGCVITLCALFLLLPLSAIVLAGLPGLPDLPAKVYWSALISIIVALASTLILLALALPMAAAGLMVVTSPKPTPPPST